MPVPKPLFDLGRVVATPGAHEAVRDNPRFLTTILGRHQAGDWGEVGPEDSAANADTVVHRERLMSAYSTPAGTRLWVITEADRYSTCVLLPSEY